MRIDRNINIKHLKVSSIIRVSSQNHGIEILILFGKIILRPIIGMQPCKLNLMFVPERGQLHFPISNDLPKLLINFGSQLNILLILGGGLFHIEIGML
jgi:hypothetical protein